MAKPRRLQLAVRWHTTAGDHLAMEHENTYAQLARVEWSSDGSTR